MKREAFTLVEMIVVTMIIACIVGVVLPEVLKGIDRARVAQVVGNSKAISTAAYAMYIDTGLWPGSNWTEDSHRDPLSDADQGEGFLEPGDDPDMPSTWDGPYLEKWPKNPWGGVYWWDYEWRDINGDGLAPEHILWIDHRKDNGDNRIPLNLRLKIDKALDDGDLAAGRVQVWEGNPTKGNFGFIAAQGQ